MRRFPVVAALALLLSTPLLAGVEVTATGAGLDVTAVQAPVSEVLDGLARKSRMKVVYEGPVPRTPVTVHLRGRTPAQAVLGVLEGSGLNYALVLDVSGAEVETLMIMGTGALSASAGSARPPLAGRKEMPYANPEDNIAESEEAPEGEVALPQDLPKADDDAKPALPPGPLNPAGAFPNSSPFAPGPRPLVMPSPTPTPPSSR